jgi:biopolymer transport protein ExbD
MAMTTHHGKRWRLLTGMRRRPVLSLAPLVDVTFILLIFFMLVTQFSRYVPVEINLGAIEAVRAPPAKSTSGAATRLIRLNILADGVLELDLDGDARNMDLAIAVATIAALPATGKTKPVVVVDPQEAVLLERFVVVMEALSRMDHIAVAIVKRSGGEVGR